MASDSLGTMTVGVTANVSDAERALNSLANMLEKFDRQQQTRARSASSGGRGAGSGGGGYFSPMSEEFNAEIRRMEMVQKRTEAALRFREIRQSELGALTARGTEPHMASLANEFRQRQQREINDLQAFAEQQQRIEQRKIDSLQVFAEREEQNASRLEERRRAQQQREIDDLQVFAERMESELQRQIDSLQVFAERQEAEEQQRAENLRRRHQREIDDLQVFAERQEAEERRMIDALQVQAERDEERRRDRVRRKKALLQREIDDLQIWAERQEQIERDAGQALDDNMRELGRKFRAGMFDDEQGGLGGMGDSANRARFAVMNLAYGVQDFAQTIGTGGFPAAVRASANNLTGLAVLFDKTAYASGGLKAALMTPEVGIIAVATGALFAADAIEKYQKSLQKAAAENAKAQFARFDVAEAGQIGEREARFKDDLAQAKNLADAQKIVEQKQRDDRAAAERENREKTVAQQERDMLEAEKKVMALRERLKKEGIMQPLDATGMGPAAQALAKEQAAALNANELELRAKIAEGTAKVKEAEEAINKTVGERIQLLKELDAAERNLRRARRDDVEDRFNRAFAENMRDGQRQEEDRIRIGRRDFAESVRKMETDVMELERKARFDPFANTGAASRNTAAEYEALVRARAPGNLEANDLSAMKQLLQEQKEILRKIEENTKETYEGPPPTVDELINGI